MRLNINKVIEQLQKRKKKLVNLSEVNNKDYYNALENIEKLEKDKEELLKVIIEANRSYDGSKEKYDELENLYNTLHRLCDILTLKKGTYQGVSIYKITKESPCVFVVNAKPKKFILDDNILESVSVPRDVYTLEEAEMLIKWTVNNTRNNFSLSGRDDNLMGWCGFGQFSTLYPLQKLGLKITINNASSFGGGRHAFGTVIIPVEIDGNIVEKQYLIDCTYSQFFLLYNCVQSMYNDDGRKPDAGYFIKDDIEKKNFISKMIEDGYCEFNLENMRKYAYGLYMSMNALDKDNSLDAHKRFEEIDFINIINNVVEDGFKDFDEEEFLEAGLNLEIVKERGRLR